MNISVLVLDNKIFIIEELKIKVCSLWGGGGQRFEILEWLDQTKAKRTLNRSP